LIELRWAAVVAWSDGHAEVLTCEGRRMLINSISVYREEYDFSSPCDRE